MPLPKPTEGEAQREFLGRCMADDMMNEEYDDNDQRFAVCQTQWQERNKGANMKIERKAIEIKLSTNKPGSFVARIATLNQQDHDGDVTMPGAFAGKTVLISAYQHGSWAGQLPVGKAIIKESGEDVIAEGEFNLQTETGREHYEAIKFSGELQEWSYGFKVLETASEKEMDEWVEAHDGARPTRILKKVEPYEISPVLKGAGIGTATVAIKGRSYEEEFDAVLAAVADFAERSESLADLRRKEGRVLSTTNMERMHRMMEQMRGVMDSMEEMLAMAEPSKNDGKAQLMALLKLQSELNLVEARK